MAIWNVQSPPVDTHSFVAITRPVEVLAEFDGPLTITFLDRDGSLILAHLCAVDVGISRYLACRTTERTVDNLKRGATSIRAALTRQSAWLIDVASDGSIANVWQPKISDLPAGAIPEADVLLYPELEEQPQLDVRAASFLRSESDAQLAFDGAPVVDHEIDASFFGKFCDRFHELVSATAEAIGVCAPKLMLGMTSKSSYAVDFRLRNETREMSAELFPRPQDDEKITRLCDSLVSMILDETQPPEIVTLIKRSQPVRRRYGSILELMSQMSVTLAIRTRKAPEARRLTNRQAAERFHLVKNLGYPYSFLQVRGTLIGGQIEKVQKTDPNFVIRVNGDHYKGLVDVLAIQKMELVKLGDEVSAKLEIQADEGRDQTYKLRDIELAADGSPHGVT